MYALPAKVAALLAATLPAVMAIPQVESTATVVVTSVWAHETPTYEPCGGIPCTATFEVSATAVGTAYPVVVTSSMAGNATATPQSQVWNVTTVYFTGSDGSLIPVPTTVAHNVSAYVDVTSSSASNATKPTTIATSSSSVASNGTGLNPLNDSVNNGAGVKTAGMGLAMIAGVVGMVLSAF